MKDDAYRAGLLQRWQAAVVPHATMQGRRVLITGARGQVGLCAVHAWLAAGAEVVALTRQAPVAFTHARLQWLQGDLMQPEAWVDQLQVNVVVFTAGLHLLPALMPLLAARGVRRVVAFGSTSMHSKAASAQAWERETAAQWRAHEDALMAMAQSHGIGLTILRPTLIYGIGLDRNVASIAAVMRRLPIFPLAWRADGLRQPVHAMDLAQASLQAVMYPASVGQAYDLGGGERLTYRAMVKRIAAQLGRRVWVVPVPGFAALLDIAGKLIGRPQRLHGEIARRMAIGMVFDDQPARRDLQWRPRQFLDTSRQPAATPFF